jgi:hypothetical protein
MEEKNVVKRKLAHNPLTKWAMVTTIKPEKNVGFARDVQGNLFYFSLKYHGVKGVEIGDIIKFVPHPAWQKSPNMFPVAAHANIIAYSLHGSDEQDSDLQAEPKQAVPEVEAHSS